MKVRFDNELSFSISDVITHQWGYTVVVSVFDSTGPGGGFCLVWPKPVAPNQTEVLRRTLARLARFRQEKDNYVEPPEVEYKVRYAEVMELLIGRGYLKEGQNMEDLPDLTVIVPKVPLWRRIWDFLSRPLWG